MKGLSVILILSILVGCSSRTQDLETVDYTPLPRDDWKVSTPAEQGLDPMLVAELYLNATEMETLYGLLVVKNGYLIAEGYFNEGAVEQPSGRQSATKRFTSALVGIALDQGCLSSVVQKMMDFSAFWKQWVQSRCTFFLTPLFRMILIRKPNRMECGLPLDA